MQYPIPAQAEVRIGPNHGTLRVQGRLILVCGVPIEDDRGHRRIARLALTNHARREGYQRVRVLRLDHDPSLAPCVSA